VKQRAQDAPADRAAAIDRYDPAWDVTAGAGAPIANCDVAAIVALPFKVIAGNPGELIGLPPTGTVAAIGVQAGFVGHAILALVRTADRTGFALTLAPSSGAWSWSDSRPCAGWSVFPDEHPPHASGRGSWRLRGETPSVALPTPGASAPWPPTSASATRRCGASSRTLTLTQPWLDGRKLVALATRVSAWSTRACDSFGASIVRTHLPAGRRAGSSKG
jgi:hypothetical protein